MVSTDVWHVEREREQLLAAIGKVTVRWAAVDLLLKEILESVLGNREAAHTILFRGRGAGLERLQTFENIIAKSSLDQPQRVQILQVTERLKALIGARNDIVHSPMTMALDLHGRNWFNFRLQQVRRDGSQVDVSEKRIDGHLKAIGNCLAALEEIVQSFIDPDESDFIE